MSVNSNALVSIITVCFNSEKYIRQTIDSVINQTYDNIEYIIVDGASSDSTVDIINEYAKKYPSMIKVISEPDTGIYDAMNKGIKIAKGNLIGLINSDDWYEKDAVNVIVEAYAESANSVIHGFQRTIQDDVEKNVVRTNISQINKQMIEHPTCFLPKLLYEKYGLFNTTYKYGADYELMLRLKKAGVDFRTVDSIIANFREGGASHKVQATFEVYDIWYMYGIISFPMLYLNKFGFWLKKKVLSVLRTG
ncbi:glycosyltransferase [Rudanella paleaurantiibacter]|uniref:Glycosyltransferase n=1 Tax=Rudanella paleaurantiibacter TaxID=2614655 RepID=A0A7J5TXR4_9BACT|nr:glycosyltransferase family 2 protein [Rudanella paleaurantiibacter]KAB7729361.1 glycosyltransferase [Rudanella paleaurantiibacter]